MIIEERAKNCYVFEDDITFSMKADMRNKKFGANVHKENNFNVLKTVGIYGPNNAGKTCLIKCIRAIKNVLLNKKNGLMPNIFAESDVCELGITFMSSGRKFSYDFKYDTEKEEYIYESFSEIFKDQYNNEKGVCWLKKDTVSETYECIDEVVQAMIPVVSKNNLLCYVIDTSKFEHINEMKQILVRFAEKVDIINWSENPAILIENALSPAKVIAVMADPDEKTALVVVPDYQLSLAIGKEGQNARFAARLTGFKIDIKSETQAKEAGDFYDYEDDEYEDEYEEFEESEEAEECARPAEELSEDGEVLDLNEYGYEKETGEDEDER